MNKLEVKNLFNAKFMEHVLRTNDIKKSICLANFNTYGYIPAEQRDYLKYLKESALTEAGAGKAQREFDEERKQNVRNL